MGYNFNFVTRNLRVCCTTEAVCRQWDQWSDWSECSTSCDSGSQTRNRTCMCPNDTCTGETMQTEHCNITACQQGKITFHDLNCKQQTPVELATNKQISVIDEKIYIIISIFRFFSCMYNLCHDFSE